MTLFKRTPADQAELEARVLDQDFGAALEYLRRFVAGGTIDHHYVIRALALVAVSEYRG
jgi:hypothetical protein